MTADVRYGREWVVRLPYTAVPLSLNSRDHWRERARKVAGIRADTTLGMLAQSVSWLDCRKVDVTLTYVPRDKRRRDADNLVGTLKACCDGIVDAGVVVDDTPDLMVKHMPVILPPDGDPRLTLTIREIL